MQTVIWKRAVGVLASVQCVLLLLTVQVTAADFVIVENTDSGDLTYISVPEHEVVKTVQLDKYLDDLVVSRDGKTIYVNRVETLGNPMMRHAGEKGELYAIDTLSGDVKWTLELDGWPHHMTMARNDQHLFIPLFDKLGIAVVDVRARRVVKMIQAPLGVHGTKLSPDGRKLYTGSMLMDVVVAYDLVKGTMAKAIPFKDAIRPFAITSDEKKMYVQLSHLHGFKVVDLETEEIIREVAMPPMPEGTVLPVKYPHTVNHGLELSPDEKYLLAASSLDKKVAVYSHPELELVKVIPTGEEPNWIIFSEDSKYAYVTNRQSDDLSIIDMETLSEIKRLPMGDRPQRMRFVSIKDE